MLPMAPSQNVKGILLMVAAMAAFALADSLVKVAASFASPPQVLFFLMGGGLISFAAIALSRGNSLSDPKAFSPILLLRYLAEVAGMVGMIFALTYVPISTVGAITQAAPILVAVGAVIFLNEKVGWRRWLAILLGFVGVLFVVQPGAGEFNIAILWAILAAIGLAGRDLTTRLAPSEMPSASLATYTMVAAVPVAVIWIFTKRIGCPSRGEGHTCLFC